ncbi:hypothetical protein NDU88_006134 [Pleurodeles waltl]|uniref:Uncharacterized protein n=1 Tax=Pleurodeles waltl TaxID=8319 RepID=A0AAV7TZ89_PLEWA|nr:hypothetical protein NDU88_006134 [Pleurodeles waltl]
MRRSRALEVPRPGEPLWKDLRLVSAFGQPWEKEEEYGAAVALRLNMYTVSAMYVDMLPIGAYDSPRGQRIGPYEGPWLHSVSIYTPAPSSRNSPGTSTVC